MLASVDEKTQAVVVINASGIIQLANKVGGGAGGGRKSTVCVWGGGGRITGGGGCV